MTTRLTIELNEEESKFCGVVQILDCRDKFVKAYDILVQMFFNYLWVSFKFLKINTNQHIVLLCNILVKMISEQLLIMS